MCSFVLCFLIGMMLSVDLVTAGEKKNKNLATNASPIFLQDCVGQGSAAAVATCQQVNVNRWR